MDAPAKAGDIIDGRYRLERVVGSGGMAVVVAAIDIERSERVALKFLFKKAARHKEILQRFEREKSVIGRLEGEHVARMLGAGIVKNTPYMVMEYLQGRDLADLLRVQQTLPVEQAVEYILQACEAVAEAHGLDIVHRDLKPGNLFLTHRPDGTPCIKVLDFGIAKILGGGDQEEKSLTRTEVVMGSPNYMSPEQMISAKDATPATDIWALGVILHELVAGTLPFAERSTERLCARVLQGEPTPLRKDCPSCPEQLENVVLRCLQRMPQDRFGDIAEFAKALAPLAPESAQALVPRIEKRLRQPRVSLTEEQLSSLVPARNPEEASEAPTVYLPKPAQLPWKFIVFVGFGLLMAGLGFAGGLVFQRPVQPAAPDSIAATTASSHSVPASSSAPLTVVERAEHDDHELVQPIEIDLDDMVKKESDTVRRKPAASASSSPRSSPTSSSVPRSTPSASSPETVPTRDAAPAPTVSTAPASSASVAPPNVSTKPSSTAPPAPSPPKTESDSPY